MCKHIMIILTLLFFSGCLDTNDSKKNLAATKTYIPLKIDLSGNNGVATANGTISLSSGFNRVQMALTAEECRTYSDIGTGQLESIVADPDRCYTAIEKVDSTGGYVKWIEESTTTAQQSIAFAPGNTTENCGIIKTDGTVFDVSSDLCPKQNGGFLNSPALTRASPTTLRGLSSEGYIEYDQSNDTTTVIVQGNISQIHEVEHANTSQIIYKTGTKVIRLANDITTDIPQLENTQYHQIDTAIQFRSGTQLRRCYFDDDGVPTQGPNLMVVCNGHSEPVNFAYWIANGVDLNGLAPQPTGPQHINLQGCESSLIGVTTVFNCDGAIYKYTDSSSDLVALNGCALGNCGNSFSVSCTTESHFYVFTPFAPFGIYTSLRLTRIDILNETYINIYDNIDTDYLITEMSCSPDSVTARTATKTILIENADTTPVLTLTDIVVDEVF